MTDNKEDQRDVDLFGELFVLTAQTIFRSVNLSDLHLTTIDHMTMMTIYSHSGISMSDLAEAIGLSSAQISRTVTKLEERGLAQRRHNENNRRIVNAYPTTKGQQIVQHQMHLTEESVNAHLGNLSGQERATLTANFTSVLSLLGKAGIVKSPALDDGQKWPPLPQA